MKKFTNLQVATLAVLLLVILLPILIPLIILLALDGNGPELFQLPKNDDTLYRGYKYNYFPNLIYDKVLQERIQIMTAEEVNEALDGLASFYCELSSEVIAKTANQSEVKALFIDNEASSSILIVGGVYGYDVTSPVTIINLIEELVKCREVRKYFFDQYNWYIIPLLNPDGYTVALGKRLDEWFQYEGNNAKVKLNRNFEAYWDIGDYDKETNDYPYGSKVFSELETRGLRDYVAKVNNIKVALVMLNNFYIAGAEMLNEFTFPNWYAVSERETVTEVEAETEPEPKGEQKAEPPVNPAPVNPAPVNPAPVNPAPVNPPPPVKRQIKGTNNSIKSKLGTFCEKVISKSKNPHYYVCGEAARLKGPQSGTIIDWLKKEKKIEYIYNIHLGISSLHFEDTEYLIKSTSFKLIEFIENLIENLRGKVMKNTTVQINTTLPDGASTIPDKNGTTTLDVLKQIPH